MKLNLSKDVGLKLESLEKTINNKIDAKKLMISSIKVNKNKSKYDIILGMYVGIIAGSFISTYLLLYLGSVLCQNFLGSIYQLRVE